MERKEKKIFFCFSSNTHTHTHTHTFIPSEIHTTSSSGSMLPLKSVSRMAKTLEAASYVVSYEADMPPVKQTSINIAQSSSRLERGREKRKEERRGRKKKKRKEERREEEERGRKREEGRERKEEGRGRKKESQTMIQREHNHFKKRKVTETKKNKIFWSKSFDHGRGERQRKRNKKNRKRKKNKK